MRAFDRFLLMVFAAWAVCWATMILYVADSGYGQQAAFFGAYACGIVLGVSVPLRVAYLFGERHGVNHRMSEELSARKQTLRN